MLACVGFNLEELTTNVANKIISSIVLCFEMLAFVSVSAVLFRVCLPYPVRYV